jgi:hypothetical protein
MHVSLKCDNHNRYFTWRTIEFSSHLAQFLLEWEMFQTKVVEKIKTQVLRSRNFFQKSCRLWDNVEKYCRTGQVTDGNIIRRMRSSWWIPKAKNTHWEYAILIVFPLQQRLHKSASILRFTYMLKNTVLKRQVINTMYKTSVCFKWDPTHSQYFFHIFLKRQRNEFHQDSGLCKSGYKYL